MRKIVLIFTCIFLTFNVFSQSENSIPSYQEIKAIVRSGNIEKLVRVVDQFDLDLNEWEQKKFDMPFLHYACSGGHVEIVKYLLKNDANPNVITKYGTAADWASENSHFDVLFILLDNGFDPKVENMSYWVEKYQKKKSDVPDWLSKIIEIVFKHKVDYTNYPYTEYTDPSNNHLLNMSLLYDNGNDLSLAQKLINKGVNVNLIDKSGYTPLIRAIDLLNIEAVKLLIENGADVNFPIKSEMAFEMTSNDMFNNNITPLYYSLMKFREQPDKKKNNPRNNTTAKVGRCRP